MRSGEEWQERKDSRKEMTQTSLGVAWEIIPAERWRRLEGRLG